MTHSTASPAKTSVELKREYWSQPHLYFTRKMIDTLVAEYGDRPATTGEAAYALNYHITRATHLLIEQAQRVLERVVRVAR